MIGGPGLSGDLRSGVQAGLPSRMPIRVPIALLDCGIDGGSAQQGGEHSIERAGVSAALDVTELRDPQVESEAVVVLLEIVHQGLGVIFRAFCDHRDRVTLAAFVRCPQLLAQCFPARGPPPAKR